MNIRAVQIWCVVLLLAAWGIDLITPQLFVVAVLLNAPIALSSFALDRRLTIGLVIAAELANISAGYVNGVHEHYQWSAIAIADRVLAGLTILLVGFLTVATQRAAERAGRLAARQARARQEHVLRRSIEAIRSSLNVEIVFRSIVREVLVALDVDRATLYSSDTTWEAATTYVAVRGSDDVRVSHDRPSAEIASLMQRTLVEREVVRVDRNDALGRFALDTLGVHEALMAPLLDREVTFGTLIVAREHEGEGFEDHALEFARAFVDQAATALAQAKLFVKLADANEEFARANRALAERSDVIRDIVYALSHDLRTPLAAAGMTMRQALDGAFGALPDAYREILATSIASNDELGRLAETLLLVARYESGDESRTRQAVSCSKVTRQVVSELRSLWSMKNVDLQLVLEVSEEDAVLADESELRRALTNLLANAISWTPAGKAISVNVSANGEQVRWIFEDDGYGVPPEMRDALFERFPNPSARRGAGTGLGLYIVRRIAEHHGGSVAYRDRDGAGGGSIFTLSLPRAQHA